VVVSDDKSGGDKRKPKATFGDVMLGIPSGRAGQKEEREGGPRRRERGGEGAKGAAPAAERKERPKGPMVVIKRAAPPLSSEATPASEGVPEHPAASAPEPAPQPQPTPSPTPVRAPDDSLHREVPEIQSFAEMFEEAHRKDPAAGKRHLRIGEKVTGKIFQLGADTAFVSLGGRSEAMIELRELQDEEGILRYGVGDEIEAHVIQTGAKGILLSRALGKGSASLAMLSEARATGMPVEGMVLSVRKGGVEVAVGELRAFCPVSQLDLRFVDKPEQFVGEKLLFKVIEAEERNVVLSRRAVLEQEQRVKAVETRKSLAAGKTVKGTVTSVREFGAFVDLGGVEGMIPVSELSHVRVGHPSEVVKAGDEVEVEVLRIEAAQPTSPDKAKHKERITLSLRARQEDPWKAATAELTEGSRLKGKVVRLQPFGAFVELRPGVDGLIHVSALSERRIAHPRDVVSVGEEVWVEVEKVDPKEKRIGLRRITEEESQRPPAERRPAERQEGPRPKVGQVVAAKVDRIEPFGVFVKFPGGRGLIPASETGTDRGTDLKRHFQIDQELKAAILEIDGTGKIRLSLREAERAEERATVDAWTKSQQPKGSGSKGFGTLGDLLKDKLRR
jgi:small subunit ribosomal protein S1